MAAGIILSPVGLIICVLIPTITILIARRPAFSARRLVAGYIGALLVLAVAVAVSSYVSPEDAVSVWQVPPERYWHALVWQFVSVFVVAAFASIVGISLVGIPVLIALSNAGRATVPWLVGASVLISTVMAILGYLLMRSSSNITLPGTLGVLVITHGILTIGFSLAAGLPWASGSKR